MKYVVQWMARDNTSVEDAHHLTSVFQKWQPSPNSTFHQFVERCDGQGGFAVVEGDNPADLLRDAAIFSPWFVFDVYPVMDVMDAFAVQQEALAFLDSIPS